MSKQKYEITKTTIAGVAKMIDSGLTQSEIAGFTGISASYISNIALCIKAGKNNDIVTLAKWWNKFNPIIRLCCEYYGIGTEIVENIANPKPVEVKKEEPKEEPKADVKPAGNEQLFLTKIIEGINKQNELLEQLMDVVIPKYTKDLSQAVDVNCDVINKELILQSGYLDNIRGNIKKGSK